MTDTRKPDRRILRTRRFLREALMQLVMTYDYETLTITDIVNAADIRRATFYLHYENIDALLLAALAYEFDEVIESTSQTAAIVQILHYLEQHSERFQYLSAGRAGRLLHSFLRNYLKRLRIQAAGQHTDNTNSLDTLEHDFIIEYQTASEAAMILWWLKNKMPCTPEEMMKMLADSHRHGIFKKVDSSDNT